MNSTNLKVPFQPIREELYSSFELMDGFDPADPDSMARTLDFESYRYFKERWCGADRSLRRHDGGPA